MTSVTVSVQTDLYAVTTSNRRSKSLLLTYTCSLFPITKQVTANLQGQVLDSSNECLFLFLLYFCWGRGSTIGKWVGWFDHARNAGQSKPHISLSFCVDISWHLPSRLNKLEMCPSCPQRVLDSLSALSIYVNTINICQDAWWM